jgi:protein-tyrosine-phosphatase
VVSFSPVAVGARRSAAVICDSAGTLDIEGRPPTANALAVMREVGVSIAHHRSKGLREAHLRWADHALMMTLDHAAAAHARDPLAGAKVRLLGPYGGKVTEIDDPIGWWRPTYRKTRGELERAIDGLLDRLLDPDARL